MKKQNVLLLSSVLSVLAFVLAINAADTKSNQNESEQTASAGQPVEPPQNTNEYKPSTSAADSIACKKNLEAIATAIEAYRRDHKDIPNWLSDLVPNYLKDTNVLICPVTRETERLSPYGVLDPKVRSSYLYEFTPTPIPRIVKGAWPGAEMTMRDWKRQQMGLVGSDVPVVRCLLHDPALNLSFGGKVYESSLLWEDNFKDVVSREALSPH